MENNKVYLGDNLEVLKTFPKNSIDSIVTDPPYGISFMNKKWDYDIPSIKLWKECLRVLKPGGHILVACGTRTQHRMAYNIEEAGFEIRDIIAWVYGSGFPKSHDVSKAIDKTLGAEREVVGSKERKSKFNDETNTEQRYGFGEGVIDITAPSTDQAKQYEGWGTALKPAMELFTLARKPFNDTVANNVLKYGTGGINIDGCRVGDELMIGGCATSAGTVMKTGLKDNYKSPDAIGRFPANLILSWPEEEYALKENVSSESKSKVLEWLNENA